MTHTTAAAVVALALALGACAPVQYTKADIDGRVVCNGDKMDQVDRDARRQGMSVQWINCPTITLRVI